MELTTIFDRVIGLDIHQAQITACAIVALLPDGEFTVEHRQFGAFKRDRRAPAEWVTAMAPDQVVTESTGTYWKSPYAALEAGGHLRVGGQPATSNRSGRGGHKTDIGDAQRWRCWPGPGYYTAYSRRPKLCELRLVAQQRRKLAGYRRRKRTGCTKGLTNAGIRLGVVFSDVYGKTARAITHALALAGRFKATREGLFEAFQGELTASRIFVLREIMDHIETLEACITRFDAILLDGLAEEPQHAGPAPDAALLVMEIGTDMTAFGRADRLASWAGVCPGNNESAGKRKSSRACKGNPYVRRLLCELAHAERRTQSAFIQVRKPSGPLWP